MVPDNTVELNTLAMRPEARAELYSAFWGLVGESWPYTEQDLARARQIDGYVADAVGSIVGQMRVIGDQMGECS